MKKIETELKDCYILEPDVFEDERGYFTEFYSQRTLDKENFSTLFKGAIQANRSFSKKGTLRGMHYQLGDASQAKIVECLQGAVLDVVVDIRKSSPTYKEWTSVLLTPKNHRQLLVPKGFAHGFLTLEDNTLFQYLVDCYYHPEKEDGFAFDDPEIGITWPFKEYGISEPVLSPKDKMRPTFAESGADFE